ncbi:MAG: hypothetical protein KIS68_08205 [Bauldia sp.]|nr:hypothetical protein [Bauldia sp.]
MLGLARHAALPSAAVLLALSGTAEAREVTPQEREALAERVAAYSVAVNEGDLGALFDMVPPRIIAMIVERAGLPLAEARAQFAAAAGAVMDMATAFSFKLDVASVRFLELADGSPYALIPSETYVALDDIAVRTRSDTLALLDEAEWYLVRVDEIEQIAILQSVYPLFAGLEFNGPVTQLIEP